MSLDVSTDNAKAMGFYDRIGLVVTKKYLSDKDKIEFVTYETPAGFVYIPQSSTVTGAVASETTGADDVKRDHQNDSKLEDEECKD